MFLRQASVKAQTEAAARGEGRGLRDGGYGQSYACRTNLRAYLRCGCVCDAWDGAHLTLDSGNNGIDNASLSLGEPEGRLPNCLRS